MKYKFEGTCHCGKRISLNQDNKFLVCCERHYHLARDFFVYCVVHGSQEYGSQEYRVGGCTLTGDSQ